jgi:hypothetical protein
MSFGYGSIPFRKPIPSRVIPDHIEIHIDLVNCQPHFSPYPGSEWVTAGVKPIL